jgi:glycogen(starch) synthase
VLIGDGELKGELSEMARQSDGSLILTGEKSHEETLEILKSSDLFVSASHGEGGGLTILEAASLGLPIVTTKSGGISESIERQNVGILIEIGDVESLKSTITSLSRSPDDLEKMSAASSTFANTWPSWSMVAKDTARVLARAKEKVKQLRNENN